MKIEAVLFAMAEALLITWMVEGIITAVLTRKARFVLFNFWCNAITNPPLNAMGIFVFADRYFLLWAIVGEILVLLTETALYSLFDKKRQSLKRYFLLSLITNAASVLAGVVLFR